MKANMRLQTRMGRHLIMTPQLQQAIKLLQMSRVEMEQLVEQSSPKITILIKIVG